MGADTLHVLALEWARLTTGRTCTVKIEDQIRHFLRLAVANRVREAMKNEVLGTSKELVVVGRATRAERHIAELFPKTREGRTRMKFYRDEVSRGEGDGYRSGVGAPSPRGVGGDRVAIGE